VTTTDPLPDIFDLRADDPLGEALLLQAARDGSTAAFGILYARYRSFAVGIAMRSLPHAEASAAEDVAEVAFIRVLTALRNGKGPTDTLRAYLTTTVRREVWRAQRRLRRQAEAADQWASDEDRAGDLDVSPLPVETSGLASHALLSEAFGGLSDRWRHVLWLTEVEGRKPAEVAPMLGVSAGSASALAYRARNGLVAAYIAAYRRSTTDEDCLAISCRLGEYVAAGAPSGDYTDVVAHIEGCRSCRDVSRGVDILGSVLASIAPFGLLTAGLWAKTAGVGAAGLAGVAAAAGVSAHAVAGSATAATAGTAGSAGTAASASTAATASGGLGLAGGVAATAAVAALAGAAWFGLIRSDATPSAAPPVTTTVAASAPNAAEPTEARAPATTRPADAASSPVGFDAPADGAAPPTTRADAPTTTAAPSARPPATSPATVPTSSTVPSTSTTEPSASTTSTTVAVEPPADDGVLTGRAIRPHPQIPDVDIPVDGVAVVAYDDGGRLAATGGTGADGRWQLHDLAPGHYLVVAVVPVAYRPASGEDPWVGGSTWATIVGSVDVTETPIDLVDLRLILR